MTKEEILEATDRLEKVIRVTLDELSTIADEITSAAEELRAA